MPIVKVPTSPPVGAGQTRVKIFLVAIEDQGRAGKKIGCGDSVVAVERVIPATTGPLRAALNELLGLRTQYYGQSGLYNALYASSLSLQDVTLSAGLATIKLTGSLKLGGECDNPRVEAQLTETALQFSTVQRVSITLNGIPLAQALSLK